MNNYFVNTTTDLDLKRDNKNFYDTATNVFSIKKRFQGHQGILKIKKVYFDVTDLFSLHEVTEDEIQQKISKLDGSKATSVGDIPVEMLKSRTDVCASLLTKITNSSLRNGCCPDELKSAEVTPIFNKNDASDKENYRPVSVLHHMPKVFERIMYIQIENFMKGKLSKFLTGFRENHSTQCCLVNMLEKWKKTLLIKVVLFVPYSWACKRHLTQWTTICQSPNLQEDALVFMKSYFTNRQRRVCVNSPFRYRVTNHAFLA